VYLAAHAGLPKAAWAEHLTVSQRVSTSCLHGRQGVRVKVKKWGDSAAVRNPASLMQAARLDLDEVVDVREEAGRIVIEPVRQRTYELGKLLKAITSKNQQEAVDFGQAVGNEAW
jgi:antitoxin MazE